MANRARAETKSNDEDSIVIKMSEWKAMTENITEVFREIQCIRSRLYLMSKKDTDIKKRKDAISKKATNFHSMLDEMRLKRNTRLVTATRMTAPPRRSEEKEGKRKEISSIEEKGDTKRKRPTFVEASYAGACAGNSSAKATTDCTDSDVKEDWIPVRGWRGKRTDTPTVVRKANAGRAALDKPKRVRKGPKRVRNRPEAILVKVGQDKEWIQIYKDLMGARETLKESSGIRRTRTGDILIELKAGSNAKKTAADMNTAQGSNVKALPIRDMTSVKIRDIDPLVSKEELARELVNQLNINDIIEVEVKTLRMAPWGTQSAIVTMPKAYLVKEGASRKIRTGLTIASIKALPNVVKCFRCHTFEHIANKCTAISPGKEICRKCGAKDHTIATCVNAPCCSICSKEKGARLAQNIEHC